MKPRSLLELAGCFAELGLRGFGGVGPQAREMLVQRRKYLDDAELAAVMGLGQFLPGPNVINVAAILGDEWFGIRGTLVAVGALILPPVVVAIGLLLCLATVAQQPLVISVEHCIVMAAAGLLVATALRFLQAVRDPQRPRLWAARLAIGALTAAIAGTPHLGVTIAVIVMVPLALTLEWRASVKHGDAA